MPCPGPKPGRYPDPDCRFYLHCTHTGTPHASVQRFACPDGLYFNPTATFCDYPANVPSCGELSTIRTYRPTKPTHHDQTRTYPTRPTDTEEDHHQIEPNPTRPTDSEEDDQQTKPNPTRPTDSEEDDQQTKPNPTRPTDTEEDDQQTKPNPTRPTDSEEDLQQTEPNPTRPTRQTRPTEATTVAIGGNGQGGGIAIGKTFAKTTQCGLRPLKLPAFFSQKLFQASNKENITSPHYLSIVRVNHWSTNERWSPHEGPVMWREFPCDAAFMVP